MFVVDIIKEMYKINLMCWWRWRI